MIIRIFYALALAVSIAASANAADRPPNIVYMMSDELAYYELGHMGNDKLKTPTIDQFAAEGIRFTSALAGAPVCGPLRCNLMTGKHAGHASVRANDGGSPLRADEATIASLLKKEGYATGGFGKWGNGGRDSTGVPEKHGFDEFFGYYDQVHAHSFYPPYLIRNSEEVPLKGNVGGRAGETYSHYEIMKEALAFIRKNSDQPFFCYLPITPPHGMYDIPEDDPAWDHYTDADWMKDPSVSAEAKRYAAMVTMVDRNLNEVLTLLRELSLEENTIVFFTGDNGGQDRFSNKQHPRGYFGPNVDPRTAVEFRGGKGNLYEGGLRIPFLVRWPGKIEAGQVSDLIFYQPDVLPTLSELCEAETPTDIDGLSILPSLLGSEAVGREQEQHDMLYWEFGQQVAVRKANWKAIRPKQDGQWELYDLSKDVSEKNDVAAQQGELLQAMQKFATASHEPVRAGFYFDESRERHERDRQAKWGSTRSKQAAAGSVKLHRISDKNLIPAEQLSVFSFSSESYTNDRMAAYAIDGKSKTVWHTEFSPKLAKHPHEIVIDLGQVYKISGFRYLARQEAGWNGGFGKTEFYLGDRPEQFSEQADVAVTFKKTREAQVADLPNSKMGRYVKVIIRSGIGGGPWASAAEIGVVGTLTE